MFAHNLRLFLQRTLLGAAASLSAVAYSHAQETKDIRTLPAVRVSADEEASLATEDTGSYTNSSSSTALGLNLSLRETPQSVTVITRERRD